MDDFGNEYWHGQDFRKRQDFNAILWRIMYFYGMVYGPNLYEEPFISLKENLL